MTSQISSIASAQRVANKNDKTVTMAPVGLLNEDVKRAGSTKDISVYYVYPDSSDSYSISQMLNAKAIEHPVMVEYPIYVVCAKAIFFLESFFLYSTSTSVVCQVTQGLGNREFVKAMEVSIFLLSVIQMPSQFFPSVCLSDSFGHTCWTFANGLTAICFCVLSFLCTLGVETKNIVKPS